MKKVLLAVAALMVFPAVARAGIPLAPDVYVVGKIGAAIPNHHDLDGFDNGLALEATAGWKLLPILAMEGSIGHYGVGTGTYFDPYWGAYGKDDLSATYVQGSVKVIAPLPKIDLYALAGLGVYFVSVEGHGTDAAGYWSYSDDDTTLGVHLGVGATLHLNSLVTLGAEAKFVAANAHLGGVDTRIDSALVSATLGLAF
jgi:outer membrane protein with beta-barrel domain